MKRLISLAGFLAFAALLSASTVLEVGFDRLSSSASRVVSGEIVAVRPVEGANGMIYSNVSLRVSRAVPRALEGQVLTVRMIGGELDGRKVYVQGMPRFTAGEEVVLFLNRQPTGVMGPTVGLWQGVFYLARDKSGGEPFVLDANRRPVVGLSSANQLMTAPRPPQGSSIKSLSLGGARSPWSVDRFFDRVRAFRASATK